MNKEKHNYPGSYQHWIKSELTKLGLTKAVCPHCGNEDQELMHENYYFTHAHHQALNYQCHNYDNCGKYFQIGPLSECMCGWDREEAEDQMANDKFWTFNGSSWDYREIP